MKNLFFMFAFLNVCFAAQAEDMEIIQRVSQLSFDELVSPQQVSSSISSTQKAELVNVVTPISLQKRRTFSRGFVEAMQREELVCVVGLTPPFQNILRASMGIQSNEDEEMLDVTEENPSQNFTPSSKISIAVKIHKAKNPDIRGKAFAGVHTKRVKRLKRSKRT